MEKRTLLLLIAIFLVAACHSVSDSSKGPGVSYERDAPVDNGYALLYRLLGDEKDLSKLLFIKRTRPEVATLMKQISNTARAGHQQIEGFSKTDPLLNLTSEGLPAAETETRKDISHTKEKALLGGKGRDLELELLLSQNEALTYGYHLAARTARVETRPERRQALFQLATDLSELQQKVHALLAVK